MLVIKNVKYFRFVDDLLDKASSDIDLSQKTSTTVNAWSGCK